MKPKSRFSWRIKLLLLLLVFAIIPAAAVAGVAFQIFEETVSRSHLDALEGLARAKAEAIDQFTDTRRKDVERMAGLLSGKLDALQKAETAAVLPGPEPIPPAPLPQLEDAEKIRGPSMPGEAPPAPVGPPAREKPKNDPRRLAAEQAKGDIVQLLGLLLGDQGTFEELLVIAEDGRVVAATFGEHEGKTAAEVEYFQRGRKATYVQPVFISPITHQLTMMIATPIRTQDQKDIGVLAARLNLKRFFRLINDSTGLGTTGETIVVKNIDDQIVFMAPTRHDQEAALKRMLDGSSPQAFPLRAATRGERGRDLAIDYRGNEVFAAWLSVPSLEWGLMTKIDKREATKALSAAEVRILMSTVVVMGMALVVSLLIARRLVKPIRELKEATDKISKGNFEVELDIRRNDEIGELADSFERMVAAIKFFRERSRQGDDDSLDGDGPPPNLG